MKRGTPDHPKVKLLAQLLNVEIFGAVGILELLWHFTAKYAPQGDVGKYSDEVIARAIHWSKRPGRTRVPTEFLPSSGRVTTELWLISSLIRAELLDKCVCHRLVVHDWQEHADEAVRKYLSRHRLDFVHTQSVLPAASSQSLSQSQQPAARSAAADAALPPAAAPLLQLIPFAAAACLAAPQPQRNEAEKALLKRADDIRAADNPEGLALTILGDFGITPPPRKKKHSANSQAGDYDELAAEIARRKHMGA